MSQMNELFKKVADDSGLQTKLMEIMSNSEQAGEEATSEKLVEFAADAGYDVSIAEMKDFFKGLAEKSETELSDEELDMVAGGKMSAGGIVNIFASILTVGILCANLSASEAINGGDCGKVLGWK